MPPHLHNQSARDALLFWLNSAFRNGQEQLTSLVALTDGVFLLEVLKAVDPDFIDYSPDHSDPTRNLLTLRKGLASSFHRDSNDYLEKQVTHVDCHAITERHDQNEIAELITLLMCLAVTGPKQEKYINHINGMSSANPEALTIIGHLAGSRMVKPTEDEPEENMTPGEDTMTDQDRILSLEAALASKRAELEKSKRDQADSLARLELLQRRHEQLQEEVFAMQEDNQRMKEEETRGTVDAQQIRDLKKRIEEQDATIASLEEKVQELEDAHRRLTSEQAPLRDKAERTQYLEDEVQELRYQNAELEKKSNAAENYKKKILQQRDLQVEVSGLKSINQELHEKMDAQEQLLKELPRLQEVEARFHGMLQSYETQISDLTDHRKRLEHYIHEANRKIELFEEQRSHDEKYISDMREQLTAAQSHVEGGGPGTGSVMSLEQELEGGEDARQHVPISLELSRLKAENQMLRGNMASSSEASQLRLELERLENAKTRLQAKNNELFEQHAIAQEQIKALMDNMSGEGLVKAVEVTSKHGYYKLLTNTYYRSVAFVKLRREKEEASRDLIRAEKRLEELESQAADKERELLSVKTDREKFYHLGCVHGLVAADTAHVVTAVEKDSLAALEELKTADQLIASSARTELAAVQQKYNDLKEEHQEHQNELVKALIVKEKLSSELEEARDAQEKSHDKSTNEKVEKLKLKAKTVKEVGGILHIVELESNCGPSPLLVRLSGDPSAQEFVVDDTGLVQSPQVQRNQSPGSQKSKFPCQSPQQTPVR